MIDYAELTDEQREGVAYLFCDDSFGTDARAYWYELERGEVCGRTAKQHTEVCVSNKKIKTLTLDMRRAPAREHLSLRMDAARTMMSVTISEALINMEVEA